MDHHIAVSDHTAAELRRVSSGHKVERGVWVLPMGADTALFSPAWRTAVKRKQLIERLGGRPEESILLYAGRLAPEKNLDLLIDLMNRQGDVRMRLAIAGDGILRAELERRMNGHACFLGHVESREELADMYANSDVFVHPNPREPAPYSTVISCVLPMSGTKLAMAPSTVPFRIVTPSIITRWSLPRPP